MAATIEQYSSLAASAAAFAVRVHDGQVRKGTQWPYVVHPLSVGFILRAAYPGNEDLEAAGYLHDVVEDTEVTRWELVQKFGPRVVVLINGVTNSGNWRLEDYIDDKDVLRLKAADTLDNVLDTIRGLQKGHDVWARFSAGKRKADTWRRHADLICIHLDGEPLAVRLHDAVLKAQSMRG